MSVCVCVCACASSSPLHHHDNTTGATGKTGPWVIGLDMPSYLPCMQFCKSRAVREKLYRAFVQRASEGEHDNAPNVQRILGLKKELATLLGFENFAEVSLASKMVRVSCVCIVGARSGERGSEREGGVGMWIVCECVCVGGVWVHGFPFLPSPTTHTTPTPMAASPLLSSPAPTVPTIPHHTHQHIHTPTDRPRRSTPSPTS